MRINNNLILIIIIILVLTQCKTSSDKQINSTNQEDNKKIEGKLIGSPLKSIHEKEKELNLNFEFETIDVISSDINGDGDDDLIKIDRIKDWGDPGDFHRITIHLSGQEEIMFFNIDGWVKISDYETQFTESFINKTLCSSKYVALQKISDKDIALFSFGYAYASQPGLLTLINLTRFDKPKLIFNDNYHLYKLEDLNNDGEKDIVVTKTDKEDIKNKDNLKYFELLNGWCHPFQSTVSSK